MLDYEAYVELFNTGDDVALVERFFAEDCAMLSSSGTRRGKAGMKEFLAWAHDGVREVIRVQSLLQEGDLTFAEVDMDFHATKARPDFPFGAMMPGDLITVKFFALYRSDKDGRIVELKTSAWPPEQGVTKLPRLGPHPSQLAAFKAYGAAFSNADFERWPKFYTEDVVFNLHAFGTFEGKQAIVDFYLPIFADIREQVTFNSIEASDTHISADAESLFVAIRDAPDCVLGPMKLGDKFHVPVMVDYELRDGLICQIDVTRNGERTFIPADA
jgi:ketosteroid isomerase-like protein